MIRVMVSRLWWWSLLFLVLNLSAKVWAFWWWRVDMVDALAMVLIVWLFVLVSADWRRVR